MTTPGKVGSDSFHRAHTSSQPPQPSGQQRIPLDALFPIKRHKEKGCVGKGALPFFVSGLGGMLVEESISVSSCLQEALIYSQLIIIRRFISCGSV